MFWRFGSAIAVGLVATLAQAATTHEWNGAADKILADIRATHPNPFSKVGEQRFSRQLIAIKADMATLSDAERVVRLMRWVATIGDGHTQLEPDHKDFASWYPIRIYHFEDGYFVTGVHRDAVDLVGAKVLAIDNHPVGRVVSSARSLMAADNRFDAKRRLFAIHSAALMQGLGYADEQGQLQLTLELSDGKQVERTLSPITSDSAGFGWIYRYEYHGPFGAPGDWISVFDRATAEQLAQPDDSRPLHLRHRQTLFATPVQDSDAYYIQANGVFGNPGESISAFFRRTLTEVDQAKPKRLILDLRQNFGGDGSQLTDVLRQFIARYDDPPWQEFYLITGRRTFSAGVLFVAGLREYLRPTLVGEPAGAPLNMYGDANSYTYPEVGLRLYVSAERHQRSVSSDLRPFLPVDYPARWTFEQYAAGRDPAIDPIVAGDDLRNLAAIAAADGAAQAIATYERRARRFDDTWAAPGGFEFLAVMRELTDAQRPQAALAVAQLNAHIHASAWRSWYNLGDMQRKAGLETAAIESFRRCVALNDPTNFNADYLKSIIARWEAKQSGG